MTLTLGCELERHEGCLQGYRGNVCPCICHVRRRPHLASPPPPSGFQVTAHPAIRPESDALDAQLRRMREAQ